MPDKYFLQKLQTLLMSEISVAQNQNRVKVSCRTLAKCFLLIFIHIPDYQYHINNRHFGKHIFHYELANDRKPVCPVSKLSDFISSERSMSYRTIEILD